MGGKCCCALDKSADGRTPIQTGNDVGTNHPIGGDATVAPAPVHAFDSSALGTVAKDRDTDEQSEGGQSAAMSGGSRNSECDGMTKEQQKEAKRIIKEFVRTMVKGRQLTVVEPVSGKPRACFVTLNRKLDTLKIRANQDKQSKGRAVLLADIEEIVVGTDTAGSQAGIETPLDDLCVTVVLASLDCITFRMVDMEARDTLVMCLGMFSNNARAGVEGS